MFLLSYNYEFRTVMSDFRHSGRRLKLVVSFELVVLFFYSSRLFKYDESNVKWRLKMSSFFVTTSVADLLNLNENVLVLNSLLLCCWRKYTTPRYTSNSELQIKEHSIRKKKKFKCMCILLH